MSSVVWTVVMMAAPLPARGGTGFLWSSVFPIGGNHYRWGDTDSSNNSNWVDNGFVAVNFPNDAGDFASITQSLGADEFIDMAIHNGSACYPELGTLTLNAGNLGHSYTIESALGGGALLFANDSNQPGGGPAFINIQNDAGRDAITCPIGIIAPALDVSGNKLLISGPIRAYASGTQLVVANCNLTLSGNSAVVSINVDQSLGSIVLQGGALVSASSSSNLGDSSTTLDFQSGTLHPTGSFTAAQAVTIESAGANILVDPSVSLTLGGAVSGSGNLAISGGGTLALASSTPLSTRITINDFSTLALANATALGNSAATVTLDAATLTATINATINAHLSLRAIGAGSPAGATFDIPTGVTLTSAGLIDGNGALTKAGSGTLAISGTNGLSGGITVNSGALRLTTGSGNVTTNGSGAFGGLGAQTIFASSASAGSATILTTGGTVFDAGGGATIFQDSATAASATLTTNGGTSNGFGGLTKFIGAASGGTARVITNAGGAFDISGVSGLGATVGSIEGAGTYQLGGKSLTFGNLNTNRTVSGAIVDGGISGGSGASLLKVGSGTTTLSGMNNNYSGVTTVNGGTLNVSGSIASNISAIVNGGASINSGLAGALRFSGTASAGGAPITTYGSFFANAAGGLTVFQDSAMAASATLITNGGANGGFGGITAFAGAATGGTARVVTNAEGIFDISQLTTGGLTVGSIEGVGNYQLGAKSLTFGGLGTTTEVAGMITDGGIMGGTLGSIVKVGPGTTTLGGANTYSGGTTVGGGTLAVSGSLANTGSVVVNAGGLFDISPATSGGLTVGSIAGAGTIALGSRTLTIGNQNAPFSDTTFSGAILDAGNSAGGGGALVFAGGTTELTGINSYTGTTTVARGTLYVSGSISNSSGVLVNGSSTPGSGIVANLVFNGNATAPNTMITALGASVADALSFGGEVHFQNGSSAGASTLVMGSGTNGGRGGAALFLGTASGGTARVINNTGGTFDISFLTMPGLSVGSIAGGGSYLLGSRMLTFGSLSTNTSVAGTISDGGRNGGTGAAIVKEGTGATTLSGANTYTGSTTVNAGALVISGSIAGGGLTTVNAGGVLAFAGTGNAGTSPRLTIDPGGTLDISQIAAANFTLGSLDGGGNIALGSRQLIFGGSNTDTTASGVIADGGIAGGTGGSIVKVGSGTTTLGAANTYTGSTAVNAGVLQLNGPSVNSTISGPNSYPGSILTIGAGSGSAIVRLLAQDQINDFTATTINAGGLLDINGFSEYLSPITLVGGAIQTGTGFIYLSHRPAGQPQDILTLPSSTTATIAGRVHLNGVGIFNVAAGATASGIDLSVTAVCFAGGMVKNGPGNMNLSGTNAFAGGLTINEGTLTLSGGSLASDTVNNAAFVYNGGGFAGRLFNSGGVILNADFTAGNGLENDANLTIPAGRSMTLGGAGLDNEGTLAVNGVVLALSSTGPNVNRNRLNVSTQLAVAGGTLTNNGTTTLSGGVVTGAGGVLVNAAGGTISGTGTIQTGFNNTLGGLLLVGGALRVTQAWTNRGLVQLNAFNSSLSGGAISNAGTIGGLGSIGSPIANSGVIAPAGGSLYLSGAVSNPSGGSIRVVAGSQLVVAAGLAVNAGAVNLSGGTLDNNGHPLNNTGQISGYGTLATGGAGLDNNGSITFTGDVTTVEGNVTNENGRTIMVADNPAIFTGLVTNSAGATFTTTGTTATFAGGFINNGISNFAASNGSKALDGIDGSGKTMVAAASDLTADHIIQGALIIGGTGGSAGIVTIGASDVNGRSLAKGLVLANILTPNTPLEAGLESGSLLDFAADVASSISAPAIAQSEQIVAAGPAVVPEPSTLVLFAFATAGLFAAALLGRKAMRHANETPKS